MSTRWIRRAVAAAVAGSFATSGVAVASVPPDPPFGLGYPLDAAHSSFTDSFGQRRSGGRRHHGIDMFAARLTPVYAAADGLVARLGRNYLAGRYLVVEHGDGWETAYMHLNNDMPGTDNGEAPTTLTFAEGIIEGASVKAGQLIAWVGDSGNAERTTPHLHFELRFEGEAVDPFVLLVEAQGTKLAELVITGDVGSKPF
jgi:murein DD-endopeptidase MepM/ murein hydrolase activator NlpD